MYRRDLERFIDKVHFTDTCWLWEASISHRGYAMFWFKGRNWHAHRVSFMWFVGPLRRDWSIDHVKELCNNKHCVNPNHLEQVTFSENVYRRDNSQATVTHCKRGHLRATNMDVTNTYCLACKRIRSKQSYANGYRAPNTYR